MAQAKDKDPQIIHIDGRGSGRVFDGIGAVSAGGSSRLLIDYPEPYRSDILDYLFKPDFGAGFIYLKTEIGGDGNTTCGAEPSFARTRAEMNESNYQRGYEYWLMKEATTRNPDMELDGLEWCMPGWFRSVWSMDNANYLLKFIEGAKSWGLHMKYISGSWNEREYNRDWIVDSLRPLLNRQGYGNILINAPEGAGRSWAICSELIKDTAFSKAVAVVSYHYPDSYMHGPESPAAGKDAFNCGKPLWSGEDFSLGGKPWFNALYLAKNIIKCYLRDKIVKVNLWDPVASMPDFACYSNTGIMKAATPWSGHYEVWPTIWAVAHFNQFVHPGWQYLDAGCGNLPGDGVYATYKAPGAGNGYSIVIVNGTRKQMIRFQLVHLSTKVVHVWQSDSLHQFIQGKDMMPENGRISLMLKPNTIYSLTTTTGQSKGKHKVPANKPFPNTYKDDFNHYSLNKAPLSPKYFYDNSGAFEICKAPGESPCLRQMIDHDIIHWIPDSCAFTFVDQGAEWSDGSISADVEVDEDAFNGAGYAGLIIRGAYDKAGQANFPHGYRLNIYKEGYWRLETKYKVLANGVIGAKGWYRLRLQANGHIIKGYVDGKMVVRVLDDEYLLGVAGFNSGWNQAKFDNLRIAFTPFAGKLASQWKLVRSSSDADGYHAFNAVDGNTYTQWRAKDTDPAPWLMIDLGKEQPVLRCVAYFTGENTGVEGNLSYSGDKLHWTVLPILSKKVQRTKNCIVFTNDVRTRYVRINLKKGRGDIHFPSLCQFDVYTR